MILVPKCPLAHKYLENVGGHLAHTILKTSGKINVKFLEKRAAMPPEVTLDSLNTALLRFGFVVWAPIQVVTHKNVSLWQFRARFQAK